MKKPKYETKTNFTKAFTLAFILLISIWLCYTITIIHNEQSENNIQSFSFDSNVVQITKNEPSYLDSNGPNIQHNYPETEKEARAAIDYLNEIRKSYGKNEIRFDKRVFDLAVERAKDMREYNYLDHTNPYTGDCADNMKSDYEINPYEYVAENIFGYTNYFENNYTKIKMHNLNEVIDSWMQSSGHRFNLLYDGHVSGAIGCYKNMCVFLGLNYDKYGKGCYSA